MRKFTRHVSDQNLKRSQARTGTIRPSSFFQIAFDHTWQLAADTLLYYVKRLTFELTLTYQRQGRLREPTRGERRQHDFPGQQPVLGLQRVKQGAEHRLVFVGNLERLNRVGVRVNAGA